MRRAFLYLLIIVGLASPLHGLAAPNGQGFTDEAEQILAEMTVEERVGQLFLVTFDGSQPDAEEPIDTLIRQYHVSGVILRPQNDNFVAAPNTAAGLRELSSALQGIERDSFLADSIVDRERDRTKPPSYVPLFIGVGNEAADVSISQFVAGMTSFPSPMAIGATWDPALAAEAGQGLGEELSALGVNLYLGPSLDVLEEPGPAVPGDLGSSSFGGDPYWVSEMGKAYVQGLHEGSAGQMAVVAKHFPGQGGSDRPLQEEVATVRKSIDQLMQIELPPFFAVTRLAPGEEPGIADGLLASHIRYQGFQGNIRATTRPISLDAEAFAQLMALEPIQAWRQAGGVTVSDSLGSRAIRRFRDPLEQRFQPQLVARDALIAGNDLLYLGDIQNPNDPDEFTTLQTIFTFFAQKYREDPVFAQRVDEAAIRVLRLKLRIYGGAFLPSRVDPAIAASQALGSHSEVAFTVLRQGATLVSPSPEEVTSRLGGAPQLGERVVFFGDVRPMVRCTNCPVTTSMAADALERRITALYGPGAAGQVGTWNLWSFSMADLASYLGQIPANPPTIPLTPPEEVDEPLRTADWLVFSILDVNNSTRYGANALQFLLEERPDLVQDKKVVVIGFDVPYGMDATNVSKIDVFYNLYAASDAAVDVAARLLFEELTAPGASPVSVSGTGYDLINALKPDPSRVISIALEPVVGEGTPPPDVESGFRQGSIVRIKSDTILDSNGNRVPDGTPVEFLISQQAVNITQTVEAVTDNGVAETTFRLERLGLFTVEARSDPAMRSDVLQLNVQEGVAAFPTVIAPTPLPTDTTEPTETAEASTATPDANPEGGQEGTLTPVAGASALDLVFGLLGVGMVVGGSYFYLARSEPWLGSRLRCGLLAGVGALLSYNYLALGLPGASALLLTLGGFASWLVAVVGGLAAVAVYAAVISLRQGHVGLGERRDESDGSQ